MDSQLWGSAAEADAEHVAPRRGGRAEKSLGLLSAKFMALYAASIPGVSVVSLDHAASNLGVERRRMYDVVGILEACQVVVRKGKNSYTWHGLTRLPAALDALRETVSTRDAATSGANADADAEAGSSGGEEEEGAGRAGRGGESRKDKSLGLMSKRFLQLFLTAEGSVLSLEEGAQMLLGDEGQVDAARLKTKVRRLYDVANVLLSLSLIEKVHVDSRKPAFRWLGAAGSARAAATAADAPPAAEPPPAPPARRTAAPPPEPQRKQPRRERPAGGSQEGVSFAELLGPADEAAPPTRRRKPQPAAEPEPEVVLPLASARAEPHPAFCYKSDALDDVFAKYVGAFGVAVRRA